MLWTISYLLLSIKLYSMFFHVTIIKTRSMLTRYHHTFGVGHLQNFIENVQWKQYINKVDIVTYVVGIVLILHRYLGTAVPKELTLYQLRYYIWNQDWRLNYREYQIYGHEWGHSPNATMFTSKAFTSEFIGKSPHE